MKALVTGGSGFLGSHVADALADAGHEVVVYDLQPSPYLRADQSMVSGSVLDPDAVLEALRGCDVVYHLAAIADIDEAMRAPRRAIEVNVLGTANMLDAARAAGVRRFVFASSIYVYSSQGAIYRTTKQACENLVQDYRELYGIDYTILRFGSLFGTRAGPTNSVQSMLTQAIEQRRIDYSGSGSEVREYIHVLDAAKMAVEVLAPSFANEIVHLTGRDRMTTGEMLKLIAEILGNDVEIHFHDKRTTGHYVQTPYNFTPRLGRKMTCNTYIDLGLGLLDCMQHLHGEITGRAEANASGAPSAR